MSAKPACPDKVRLAKLHDGSLLAADQTELVGHVDHCPHCQAAMEQLSSGTQWQELSKEFRREAVSKIKKPITPAVQNSPSEPTWTLLPDGTPSESGGTETLGEEWQTYLTPSERPNALGRLGHYEILELLGRGGMGVVLKGFDVNLQRVVAIKLLSPALAGSATARKRFVREARAAAAVRHGRVVNIYEVDDSGPLPFLVMEFIAGVSLDQRLKRGGALSLKDILLIGIQVADGLAAAHKQGLVHRDIKPGNILLEEGGHRIKITDFGLARAVDDATLTQSGVIAGTPMYMAPEQALGEAVDHRADLFSFGCVLYAMCTGDSPFRATGSVAVIRKVCDVQQRPIREINPAIPPWLCDIIEKLLAKDRRARFDSAKAVVEELRQHVAAMQAHHSASPQSEATTKTLEAPKPRPRARRRIVWAVGAAGCLVLVAAVVVPLLIWFRSGTDTNSAHKGPSEKIDDPPPRVMRPAVADALKHDKIPLRFLELAGGGQAGAAPRELVAVFGEDNWLHPFGAKGSWIEQSADGRLLAVPSGGTVALMDADTGKHLRTLSGMPGRVSTIAFSGSSKELAVATDGDKVIRLFNVENGQGVREFRGSTKSIQRLAFSLPDGKLLASVGCDPQVGVGEAIIWDAATGNKLRALDGQSARATNVAFSPDGAMVATAGQEGTVTVATASVGNVNGAVGIWDPNSGKPLRTLPFLSTTGTVSGLAFSADGKLLAAGNGSGTAVWSTETWKWVGTWPTPGEWLAFRGQTHVLLAGPHVNSPATRPHLAVVNIDDRKMTNRFLTGDLGGNAVFALSRDGNRLFAMNSDPQSATTRPRTVVSKKATVLDVSPVIPPIHDLCVSRDGRWLVVCKGRSASVWDLRIGEIACSLPDVPVGKQYDLPAFSPYGMLLATRSTNDGTISVWNTTTGGLAHRLPGAAANFVGFLSDGQTLVSSGPDGTIKRWRIASGEELPAGFGQKVGAFNKAAISPDGAWLAVASGTKGNSRVRVLDTKRDVLNPAVAAQGTVSRLAFSLDGKTLAWSEAAAQGTTRVHLLDVATNKELPGPPTYSGDALGFALHPDAKVVAVAMADGTVRFWESYLGKECTKAFGPGPFGKVARRLAFTPEGSYLAVGDANGTVSLLSVPERLPAGANFNRPASQAKGPQPSSFAKWGTVVDPDGDCQFAMKGGALTIAVPGTPHDLCNETNTTNQGQFGYFRVNAPRVWQDVQGDFKVQVKITGLPQPEPKSGSTSRGPWLAAGLVIWQDENNFIRFVGAAGTTGHNAGAAFYQNGRDLAITGIWRVSDQGVSLRLERKGSQFVLAFKDEGTEQQWKEYSRSLAMPLNLKVGVVACNMAKLTAAAQFKDFTFEQLDTNRDPLLPPPPGTFPALPVPDIMALAKKPSPADNFKREDIPAEIMAKMGSGNDDAPKELVAVLGKPGDPHIVSMSLSGDGKLLATCGLNAKEAQLFDLSTGKLLKKLTTPLTRGSRVALSPDGKTLAIGGSTAPVQLFNTDTGKLWTTIEADKTVSGIGLSSASEIAFSPDGSLLAIGDATGKLKLWHLAEQTQQALAAPDFGRAIFGNRFVFSPDGKFLAVSRSSGTKSQIALWEAATAKSLAPLEDSTNAAALRLGLAWHPNGQVVASASYDGTIQLWDLTTMEKKGQPIRTDLYQVNKLAWHPSGRFLASSNFTGGKITLWDMRSQKPRPRLIQVCPPDPNALKGPLPNNDLIFTPEGRHLIFANADGTISVLRLAELGQTVK